MAVGLRPARPGPRRRVRGSPLFASELIPSCGPSIRQSIGPVFALRNKWLGDQWTIGHWDGMQAAAAAELPASITAALKAMAVKTGAEAPPDLSQPPQNLKEYDPEWGRAFYSGTVAASCDHARMLAGVRIPVLFTHHFRAVDGETGRLMGAISDQQAGRVRELVAAAGQPVRYLSFPDMPHSMHGQDPALFASTVADWALTLS